MAVRIGIFADDEHLADQRFSVFYEKAYNEALRRGQKLFLFKTEGSRIFALQKKEGKFVKGGELHPFKNGRRLAFRKAFLPWNSCSIDLAVIQSGEGIEKLLEYYGIPFAGLSSRLLDECADPGAFSDLAARLHNVAAPCVQLPVGGFDLQEERTAEKLRRIGFPLEHKGRILPGRDALRDYMKTLDPHEQNAVFYHATGGPRYEITIFKNRRGFVVQGGRETDLSENGKAARVSGAEAARNLDAEGVFRFIYRTDADGRIYLESIQNAPAGFEMEDPVEFEKLWDVLTCYAQYRIRE